MIKASRIAIIDDEERVRDSLGMLLDCHGFTDIFLYGSGRDFLEFPDHSSIDLLLLDLHLRDINGLEVLRVLRQRNIDAAVIVVSGDAVIESAISALRLGADDFVRKPYAAEMLLRTIDTVLKRRSAGKAGRRGDGTIEHSERVHRFLVERSPHLIFTLDSAHSFVYVADTVARSFGHERSEIEGKPVFAIVHQDDQEKLRYMLERSDSGSCEIEIRLQSCNEGEFRHYEVILVPMDLSSLMNGELDGCVRGTYVVAREIGNAQRTDSHLAYMAYHDVLTGLANRTLFRDRLKLSIIQARRNRNRVAVMFIDLDGFKQANDTFGHQNGDRLLIEMGRRLGTGLREADTLARLGGDEFTVLLPSINTHDDARIVARKLVADAALPFLIEGTEVFLTASIGVAIYPEDGDDADVLIRHADLAMYRVKAHSKNGYQLYSAVSSDATVEGNGKDICRTDGNPATSIGVPESE